MRATILTGQPPLRGERVSARASRAPPRRPVRSSATGSATSAGPPPPSLEAARGHVIEFGKFHGHTLGDIAAFEPSYIDWVAGTVTRDPELVAAARVIQADLDARGIAAPHPPDAGPPGPHRLSARRRSAA